MCPSLFTPDVPDVVEQEPPIKPEPPETAEAAKPVTPRNRVRRRANRGTSSLIIPLAPGTSRGPSGLSIPR